MIAEILEHGEENKITTEALLLALHISRRDLFAAIRKERREGELILSDKAGGGYWLWNGDMKELERYYKMQRAGALDMLKTLKPVRRLLRKEKIEKNKGERNAR